MDIPYGSAYEEVVIPQAVEPAVIHKAKGSPFKNLKADDIILVAIILLMLTDDEPDMLTIVLLGFLLVLGIDTF